MPRGTHAFQIDSMPSNPTARPSPRRSLFTGGASALFPAAAVLLAGCASAPTEAPVVRSIPPRDPGAAITNYFDLTVRGADRNRELTIGTPQRGACPMGGNSGGYVGWVVPVEYKTRSKDNGTVIVSSYFFWFSDETIRGVTRRMEVCP